MEPNTCQNLYLSLSEKFRTSQKLLDESKKCSTVSESQKLISQSVEILDTIEAELANVMTIASEEEIIMFAMIRVALGLVYVDAEILVKAERQFMKCLELLEGKELEQNAVISVLTALNQLGIIWTKWNRPVKAKIFLDRAEQTYKDFTSADNGCRVPTYMTWNFRAEEIKSELSPMEVLEGYYTRTLYYLAQVHSALKDHCKSAIYCHMTLRRQLGRNGIAADLDYIEWALNAATLSQYLLENNFSSARHHLASASYILQKYESILKQKTENNGESEALAAEWENFKHRSADVARCWAKYGILLMSASRRKLLHDETEQENNEPDVDFSKSKIFDDLKFDVLEKEIESIANQVTDKYVLDFNDARPVFLNVQQWLEQAKEYYTIECHASDYISIIQDNSKAYKYLSFFEDNEDRQAKMQKRRIVILESAVKELNPQYYKSACRQIWFELGETYSDMLDIKLDCIQTYSKKLTPQALAKINHLARNSIKYFQLFLDSLEIRNSEFGIEEFPDDVMSPAVYSYFHLGRLYRKIINVDKTEQLENMENSISAYKFVVDYCDKYPKATEVVNIGLTHCKELVTLLQIKIDRLKLETSN